MRAGSSVSGSLPSGRRYVPEGKEPSNSWAEMRVPARNVEGPMRRSEAVVPTKASAPRTTTSLKGGSPPPFTLMIRRIQIRLVGPTVSGTDRLEELRGARRPRLDHRRYGQERPDNRGHSDDPGPHFRHCAPPQRLRGSPNEGPENEPRKGERKSVATSNPRRA